MANPIGFVLYLIWSELLFLIKIRQAYMLSAWNASRISQRTVLFTDVPEQLPSYVRLQNMFYSIAEIWLVSDTSDLQDDVDEMNDTALKLEGAEINMIEKAVKKYKTMGNHALTDNDQERVFRDQPIDPRHRPAHRLQPLIGKKVDSIGYCTRYLKDVISRT